MKAGLHDWEMNLIQGMVNQLQIDFKALQISNKSKKNQNNTTYNVMEVSVKMCENVWKCVKMCKNVWKCVKICKMCENVWKCALSTLVFRITKVQTVKTGKLLIRSHYSCQFIAVLRCVFYIICRNIFDSQLATAIFLHFLPLSCALCHRGADKSLVRPTYRCILFDGENISFDTSLVIYIYIYK